MTNCDYFISRYECVVKTNAEFKLKLLLSLWWLYAGEIWWLSEILGLYEIWWLEKILRWLEEMLRWLEEILRWLEEILWL